MTVQVTTLENGLRVVSQTMENLHSVSIGMWVGVGARDEAVAQHGICHLLEHMAFKGTSRRSAREIAEEIEMVGGDLNASTGLEMTAYYVRVLKPDVVLALDILADILQNSVFDSQELALEKDVILQEIAGTQDIPEDLVYDIVQELAFPEQSLGRPIIGTPASVMALGAADLDAHLAERYVASNMVLSAAGAIEHDELVRHARALFGGLSAGAGKKIVQPRFVGGARASTRTFEQSQLVIGFEGPAYSATNFFDAQVFSGLLGGGMSSRLFQKAREERGLCYSIYASAWGLVDSGMFAIYAATGQDMVKELADVIVGELRDCAGGGVMEQELARAKAQIKAGLLMSLESSSVRAEQMARHLLCLGRIMETDELIAHVEATTPKSMTDFASKLLGGSSPAVAVVGAGAGSLELAESTHALMVA